MFRIPPFRWHSLMLPVAFMAALLPGPTLAHGVQHQIQHTQAIVITLNYDDGQALAHAVFEAAPVGAAQAAVTGLTDAGGRAVIVADVPGRWRFSAFARDGHGAVVEFEVTESMTEAVSTAQVPRWMRVLSGLALLLCVALALQYGVRRRKRRAGTAP